MGFTFPIPPGYSSVPIWTGRDFQIGEVHLPFLQYTECNSGWNADLTKFHEKEADKGNHFIDQASRYHACLELEKKLVSQDKIVLELGSSSGYLLRDMKKKFPHIFILGSDCIPDPLEKVMRDHQDIPLVQFDLVQCPLSEESIDVVVALNVLEHIEDDMLALKQLYRILKYGGSAILEVPSNPHLYDFYDVELRHFRRYSLIELCQKAENAGFQVSSASHLGFFAYPLFRFMKIRNKQKKEKLIEPRKESVKQLIQLGGPVMNTIISYLMRIELLLGKRIQYPKGIRCLVTLTKKETP